MRANTKRAKAIQAKAVQDFSAVAVPTVALEEALGAFIEYKRKAGLCEKPLTDIRYTIGQYYKWVGVVFGEERDFGRFLTLKEQRNPGFLAGSCPVEESTEVASGTRDKRIILCSSFWKWCIAEGLLQENPAKGFKTKSLSRLPSAPNTESVKKVMEKIYMDAMNPTATWHHVRNATIMMIQLASGSRAGDLLSVQYTDVIRRTFDRKIRYSIVIRGENEKTGKTRVLTGLDSKEVVKLLDKTLAMWRAYTNTNIMGKPLPGTEEGLYWPSTAPIFCTQDGEKFQDAKQISKYLKAVAKKLGVHDEWNNRKAGGITGVHDFRRYFATQYVEQQYKATGDVNILALGGMLGHSNLNTTKKYIDAVVAQKMIEETSSNDLPISNIFGTGTPNEAQEPRKRAPRKRQAIA